MEMKRKLSFIVWTIVAMALSYVVMVEVYYLLAIHLQVFGGIAEYQEELYEKLHATAHAAKKARTVEELTGMLNAEIRCAVNKEAISSFPDWSQKEYKIRHNGSFVLADWTFYDIDPILDYRGILKIAEIDGVVEAVRMEYVFCEGE